ncbi:YfcC family protein [Robertkochia aurantiaca]|uniref:YfcC family protein n=1 Tax=Robertkochia aurantiaca TaxID=2873700 RepID=UPI001CC9B835|nr:YfcC family protein [Robertkochia sp. 3YJGBD-33]
MKIRSFPSAQAILLIIAALVAVLTWVIPAGQYAKLTYNASEDAFIVQRNDRTEKLPPTPETLDILNIQIPLENFTSGAIYKPISIPGTYKHVDAKPQGLFQFLQAPVKGIIETADIIFLVLIIGGTVGVVERSGAFSAGIQWLSEFLKGREFILIISTTLLIALGGSTFGFGEETIAFLPILIPVFLAAKYDALVAVACVFLGSQVGVMASTTNPFSTIIASDAAGIVWTNGLQERMVMFLICITLTILFLLRYAKRVKADPAYSVISDQKEKIESNFAVDPELRIPSLSGNMKLILSVFMLCFVIMVYGVVALDWWLVEMTAVFFFGSVVLGLLARMKEETFLQAFMTGAGSLLGVAFIIGLARGISILMSDGMISDTILYEAGSITEGMDKGIFVNALFIVYNFIAFFVPSTSGTAVLTVPILAPLADTVNIGREVIVSTYQFGHGLFNLINPTGLLLAFLGVAKIGYDRYLRFVWPLILILAIVIMIFLTLIAFQ